MLEEPPVVVWSRPSSIRSIRSGNRVLTEQVCMGEKTYVINEEPDTLCVLPSSMRILCALLTFLLISSLAAAIFNSLQGNSRGSASYCRKPDEPFHPNILCPRETMFFYFVCCDISPTQTNKCCSKIRIWLMVALACIALSCASALVYTIARYCCYFNNNRRLRFSTVV